MHRKSIITLLSIAVFTVAMPVFAESAPVYDVDSLQEEFDHDGADEQDLPPPPAPDQEDTFMRPRSSVKPVETSTVVMSNSDLPIDQRIRRVEQQVINLQEKTGSSRIESMQKEIQSLRGQVEQLVRKLDQMEVQQKALYADLDKRIVDVAKKPTVVAESAKTATPAVEKPVKTTEAKKADASGPNVEEEQEIYQTAYNLIKAKKYNDAVNALQSMLQKYPTGQFASNAHYWLGELYGLMNKNNQALSEFELVVKRYPDSPRVSDAQFKIGLIYATQSKWSESKAAFKKVINRYPGSASARLASQQLKQISDAGH